MSPTGFDNEAFGAAASKRDRAGARLVGFMAEWLKSSEPGRVMSDRVRDEVAQIVKEWDEASAECGRLTGRLPS